jgi:hypothetical protein
MRVRWTTSAGRDPRLVDTFSAVRPDKVATATVDGAPVYVTATNAHYDGDLIVACRRDLMRVSL